MRGNGNGEDYSERERLNPSKPAVHSLEESLKTPVPYSITTTSPESSSTSDSAEVKIFWYVSGPRGKRGLGGLGRHAGNIWALAFGGGGRGGGGVGGIAT